LKYVIKIGGSAFDLGARVVIPLCKSLDKIKSSDLYITAGGGILLDVMKDIKEDYQINNKLYDNFSWKLIDVNLKTLGLFVNNHKVCTIKETEDIRGSESDVHTVRLAEELNINTIVFLKDTSGIFSKDPNRYENARFYSEATSNEMKNEISRIGVDNRGGHLIEDSAIDIFQESKVVKEIIILDCKDKFSFQKFLDGESIGSKIIKNKKT